MENFESKFDIYYEYAKQYYDKYHNLYVSVDYVIQTPEGIIELGNWIKFLRYNRIILTNNQLKKLDDIEMEWSVYLASFMENYIYLVNNSEGKKIKNILSNKKFKQWIDNKKDEYDIGKISDDRRNIMNQNIELFDLKYLRWKYHYYFAKKYYEEYGNLDVPNGYEIDGVKLWNWLETQRRNFINGLLNEEQVNLLQEIDMIWWISEYRYIHSVFEYHTKKRNNKKLNERLIQFLNMQEDIVFETKEQVKTLNYNFKNYLDYTKK